MEGKVIVITSGKGGVGKSTTTAAIGAALALEGKKVAVVDMDIGLRNLDVIMGLENRIVFNVVDAAKGKCKIKQAAIKVILLLLTVYNAVYRFSYIRLYIQT